MRQQCETAETEATEVMRAQDLPVSWQVSCAEKRAIVCHWTRGTRTQAALQRLRHLYCPARTAWSPPLE